MNCIRRLLIICTCALLIIPVSHYGQAGKKFENLQKVSITNTTDFSLSLEDLESSNEISSGIYSLNEFNNNTKSVELKFVKQGDNPLDFNYSYSIEPKSEGNYLSIAAAMRPLDLRFDNPSKVKFDQQKIFYPYQMEKGLKLENIKSSIEMELKQNSKVLVYKMVLANRKVESVYRKIIEDKEVKVYEITYDYILVKSIDKAPVSIITQKVTEQFTHEYGIISTERDGKMGSKENEIKINSKFTIIQ